MNALLALLALAMTFMVVQVTPEPVYGAQAIIVCAVLATATGLAIARAREDKVFLLRLFVGGLLLRMFIGTLIFYFGLQEFFGPDAGTYDIFGWAQLKAFEGDAYAQYIVTTKSGEGSAWGMLYLVAVIYNFTGRNSLAIQFVSAIAGAATAPVIFLCARHIFQNQRVARIAALFVAFFPSLVLWSSQGLKDGLIVFLLALSMLATLKLSERFSAKFLIVLSLTLFGLLSLRFYIFYIALAAIMITFIIGTRALTAQSVLRQVIIIAGLILALTFLGVNRFATAQLEQYADLSRIQLSRADAAASAQSGFAKETDVSTLGGAISALPIGTVYLLFAPFPWQLGSLRQTITLPEMLVWWSSIPAIVLGFWYAFKHRFRQVLPIVVFTTMLTLAYALFQGNVGTAYRQRAQILIFYFIFIAVGIVLLKERRENRRISERMKQARPLATFSRMSN